VSTESTQPAVSPDAMGIVKEEDSATTTTAKPPTKRKLIRVFRNRNARNAVVFPCHQKRAANGIQKKKKKKN
jgi:hypothetical protein